MSRIEHTPKELKLKADVSPKWMSLKELGVPWHYRCRFTNWLMAKPWRWNIGAIYRAGRQPILTRKDGIMVEVPNSEMSSTRALWTAITFPHVHHEKEL